MNNSAKTKSFSSFLMPVFILAGFFVWGFSAKAEWANHLVISEIQIAGVTTDDEFIELYNPTSSEVNLEEWDLKRRTTGNEYNILNNIQGIVKSYGYFLITPRANCGENKTEACYKGNVSGDDEYTTNSFMAKDNAILLYDKGGKIIDKVGWGGAIDFEVTAFPENPLVGQSLERKANTNSTADSLANGADKLLGNGWDSGNNSVDFVLQTVPNPQSSQSSAEPALENSQTPDSTSLQPPPAAPSTFVGAGRNVPTAEAGADKAAVVGETVEFDGSDSFDLAGKELTYSWTFGDGGKSRGAAVSHAYQMAGQYTVTLKVDNGENTAEDYLNAKISEPEFSDKITINEFLPNPAGADKDGEWIELANLSDKKRNLRGWILEAKTKTGAKRYIFPGDNFIEPNGYLLVKRSQSNLVLANTGGEVNLLLPPDKNLSKVSYGEAKEGKSYALIPSTRDIWQWTDIPTPAKENILEGADKTTKPVAEEKNTIAAAFDSSNIVLPEGGIIADEEFSSIPNPVGKTQAQNSAIQLVAFSDLEKYLGKAIGDKISEAVSCLAIKSAESDEKISAPKNSESLLDAQSAFAAAENAAPVQQQNERSGVKNDPWFYSSLILSGLSLFLIWQYQELKKKIK